MEKLKIKAKNLDQKNEIINLFILLGYKEDSAYTYNNDDLMGIHVYRDGDIQDLLDEDYSVGNHKEITLPELRALVSLHKNPINMDKVLSEVRSDALGLLEEKEYLEPMPNGDYRYHKDEGFCVGGDWIEIPEGANVATSAEAIYFWNTKNNTTYMDGEGWVKPSGGGFCSLDEYLIETDCKIIWQRHTTRRTAICG